jgi:hypothetical protein
VLRNAAGRDVLLSFAGIASVRLDAASGAPTGDRSVHVALELAEALATLAVERPRVLLVTGAAAGVAGELRAVGLDVATVRLDGDPPSNAYVRIPAIVEVTLAG